MSEELCCLCLAGPATHTVTGYNIDVCARCWRNAEDGWEKTFEPAIFEALSRAGLLIPDRNAKGRLPRAYAPPADYPL